MNPNTLRNATLLFKAKMQMPEYEAYRKNENLKYVLLTNCVSQCLDTEKISRALQSPHTNSKPIPTSVKVKPSKVARCNIEHG